MNSRQRKETPLSVAWQRAIHPTGYKETCESRILHHHIKGVLCPLIEGAFKPGAWSNVNVTDGLKKIGQDGATNGLDKFRCVSAVLRSQSVCDKRPNTIYTILIVYEVPSFRWGDVYLFNEVIGGFGQDESQPTASRRCLFASHFSGASELKPYIRQRIIPTILNDAPITDDLTSAFLPPSHIHNQLDLNFFPADHPKWAVTRGYYEKNREKYQYAPGETKPERLPSIHAPIIAPAPAPEQVTPVPPPLPPTDAPPQVTPEPTTIKPAPVVGAEVIPAPNVPSFIQTIESFAFINEILNEDAPPGVVIGYEHTCIAAVVRTLKTHWERAGMAAINIAEFLVSENPTGEPIDPKLAPLRARALVAGRAVIMGLCQRQVLDRLIKALIPDSTTLSPDDASDSFDSLFAAAALGDLLGVLELVSKFVLSNEHYTLRERHAFCAIVESNLRSLIDD